MDQRQKGILFGGIWDVVVIGGLASIGFAMLVFCGAYTRGVWERRRIVAVFVPKPRDFEAGGAPTPPNESAEVAVVPMDTQRRRQKPNSTRRVKPRNRRRDRAASRSEYRGPNPVESRVARSDGGDSSGVVSRAGHERQVESLPDHSYHGRGQGSIGRGGSEDTGGVVRSPGVGGVDDWTGSRAASGKLLSPEECGFDVEEYERLFNADWGRELFTPNSLSEDGPEDMV